MSWTRIRFKFIKIPAESEADRRTTAYKALEIPNVPPGGKPINIPHAGLGFLIVHIVHVRKLARPEPRRIHHETVSRCDQLVGERETVWSRLHRGHVGQARLHMGGLSTIRRIDMDFRGHGHDDLQRTGAFPRVVSRNGGDQRGM